LLIGFARFMGLKKLKNSARNSTFLVSPNGKRLVIEKSTLDCRGPRRTVSPTFSQTFGRYKKTSDLGFVIGKESDWGAPLG